MKGEDTMTYDELLGLFNKGEEESCQQYRNRYCEWRASGDMLVLGTWYGSSYEGSPDDLQIVGNLTIYDKSGEA